MTIKTSIELLRRQREPTARRGRRMLAALIGLLVAGAAAGWLTMIRMPGQSYTGPFEPLGPEERALETALRNDVTALAGDIGDRSLPTGDSLKRAASFLGRALGQAGYEVHRQRFEVSGKACENLWVELPGGARRDEIVIVGAHYDSVNGTVGADDNASGAAAVLALARSFAGKKPERTLRFMLFANEEPPHFQTTTMGSVVAARLSHEQGERVVAMLSLETIGYYDDKPGSQKYPFPLGLAYPSSGDFVAFVGNGASRDLVRQVVASFRGAARFPSEGIAGPAALPGIGWSDHWSYWQEGYPAVMITDTAPFRNPNYHTTRDTPDRLMYGPMARVVRGLERVVSDLAGM